MKLLKEKIRSQSILFKVLLFTILTLLTLLITFSLNSLYSRDSLELSKGIRVLWIPLTILISIYYSLIFGKGKKTIDN